MNPAAAFRLPAVSDSKTDFADLAVSKAKKGFAHSADPLVTKWPLERFRSRMDPFLSLLPPCLSFLPPCCHLVGDVAAKLLQDAF